MNSFDQIDPALIDQPLDPLQLTDGHAGYTPAQQANDTRDVLMDACGAAAVRDFPKGLWIEPKDWADKARDNDKYKTWPINYCDRFTNQNPNHFCTCHSLGTNFEIARNRARGFIYADGPKAGHRYETSAKAGSLWVSPMSVYAEANPREWGGANVQQVLEIAARRGFLPDTMQPNDYKFKHSLAGTTGKGGVNQSHGEWTPVSRFPAGWQETAALIKPLEIIFPDSWEQGVCLVLHGIANSVGRNGHAVPHAIWNDKEKVMGYIDSYDVVRYDSLGTVRGCAGNGSFGIVSTTIPDDWMKPAGETK